MSQARLFVGNLSFQTGENDLQDYFAQAGALALVREEKERVRDLVERRKQLGFPVPDECEEWWTDYEGHTGERPARLPSRLAPRP